MAQLALALKLGPWAAILLLLGIVTYQSGQIHKWHVQNDRNVAGREADRASYEAAQKAAGEQNKAQVAKIETKQKEVTDDVETRYRSDLARLRADNARLRSQGTAAPQGVARKPGSPDAGKAPGGTGGQAVPLPADELLRAQETELQLNALIDWVLGQSAIDPNETVPLR